MKEGKNLVLKIGLLVLVIAVILALLLFSKDQEPKIVYQIDGQISNIDSDYIEVSGTVSLYLRSGTDLPEDFDPNKQEEKTVKFIINSETYFKRVVVNVTQENLDQDGPFTPETIHEKGSISDLLAGVNVTVRTDDDLFNSNESEFGASEIVYINFNVPRPDLPQQ